ncbi:hypothetical protein M8C21_010691 [Ambrosia artemisiifolia]|uniref:F-box domain-containing protein n=1 Tax=Ambrosia artemisiifolia TaxID=4212 RepID=A0AAD5BWA0_AMBAR|nr:hypothetical protein M8C21_010691 [Ambrosia artemisiifolia]
MAYLLKMILESANRLNSTNSNISSNSSSSSSSDSNSSISTDISDSDEIIMSSTGEFDRIPLDVFMQILKLLGPKEAAKLTLICKSWKLIVSDNMLWIFFLQNQQDPWDSKFFAETSLRSGYPLRTYPSQMQSFMQIYGQRAQVPGAIIIDGGSGYCKFGWSKYHSPSGRAATFLEFGNIESPMYSRMQVKSSTQPTVVSIPIIQYGSMPLFILSEKGLHQAVALCIENCNEAGLAPDASWCTTIVLAGGSACLPGLVERLDKELHLLLPSSISNGIRVIPPPYGADSAWYGAKLLSNLSTFPNSWCVNKKDFRPKSRRNFLW